ncbi:CBS domain-containing protein [Corynebacterium sp.]|uniref:CBS domain-containing protein n=1 Tax=Corynebacterium sp. TaxID=1720 RepID=UPI0026E0E508|nr:CBS domain-containing protein [Corynebacterium sp.]MDO5512119.1 CBS domain-containing protein [Corynebacterium sp.]
MNTARDLMSPDVVTVDSADTLEVAARHMRDADVGSLPVVDGEGAIVGIVTDRDIVVSALAEGKDPTTVTAGELADGTVVSVSPDDSAEQVLATMKEHQIRRVPVVDGTELVGMLAQADIARSMPDSTVGDFLESVSED